MPFTVCEITAEDHDAWLALRHALWPWEDEAALRDEMTPLAAKSAALNLIAWDGERPVGLLELEIRKEAPGSNGQPVPYIEGWYVAPGYRRMGVGGALVHRAEQWARTRGFAAIASDTIAAYPDSPAAHAALGFATVSTTIEPEDGFTWHFFKEI